MAAVASRLPRIRALSWIPHASNQEEALHAQPSYDRRRHNSRQHCTSYRLEVIKVLPRAVPSVADDIGLISPMCMWGHCLGMSGRGRLGPESWMRSHGWMSCDVSRFQFWSSTNQSCHLQSCDVQAQRQWRVGARRKSQAIHEHLRDRRPKLPPAGDGTAGFQLHKADLRQAAWVTTCFACVPSQRHLYT